MSKDEYKVCKEIVSLHDNIYAAGVIQNQELVARYVKDDDPTAGLDPEQVKLMFAQPEIVLSIFRTYESHAGPVQYFLVCHEKSDMLFFPAIVDGNDRILFIRMKRTFRGEEILQKVYDYLKERQP